MTTVKLRKARPPRGADQTSRSQRDRTPVFCPVCSGTSAQPPTSACATQMAEVQNGPHGGYQLPRPSRPHCRPHGHRAPVQPVPSGATYLVQTPPRVRRGAGARAGRHLRARSRGASGSRPAQRRGAASPERGGVRPRAPRPRTGLPRTPCAAPPPRRDGPRSPGRACASATAPLRGDPDRGPRPRAPQAQGRARVRSGSEAPRGHRKGGSGCPSEASLRERTEHLRSQSCRLADPPRLEEFWSGDRRADPRIAARGSAPFGLHFPGF